LGVSFTEVASALESKNIVTALGTIRKGIATVAQDYVQPSELLEGKIVDDIFRDYLTEITRKLVDDDQVSKQLQSAANLALNDSGVWSQIKDYSLATDLVSPGEQNIANIIKGGSNFQNAILESTQGDLSGATDLTGPGETNRSNGLELSQIIEAPPSSQATRNKII
jgi:hypothetical protein